MSVLNDLVRQIEDVALRERIEKEVERLSKQKKFGLVFEEHLPECTPLYDITVKNGSLVAKKTGQVNDLYRVLNIKGETAECLHRDSKEVIETDLNELVTVAEFGEPIYPYLKPLDSVCNAPDSDLWHTLIEADNYHALQLLEYLYAGKVDCIYIDPPYNTGARDWKYNNDYVDGSDSYRHSKWLSFMQKRLKIAKKLLNPNNSVLFVTIDDKEYLHLGCLLEEIFPEARIQMISDVINPKGTMQRKKFPRTDEYIFGVWLGEAEPFELTLSKDWLIGDADNTNRNRYRWVTFVRTAPNVSRSKTPSMFYPIFVNLEGTKILRVGESLDRDVDYKTVKPQEGERVVFPINSQGREVIWHLTQSSLMEAYSKGFVKLSGVTKNGISISYLPSGMQKKITDGDIPILGRDENGAVIFDASDYAPQFMPGTQWRIKTHDATEHGTKLLQKIIGNRFSYPKSLYSTKDCINFFLCNKPNALIVDFFAGSGTTLHAVNLLNSEDDGNRRCIIVTNNEVSVEESRELTENGYKPGDEEWNKLGIARYVTWPRTVCSIEGHDVDGKPLKGNYLGSDKPMADGFKANAAFFKLGFLDKTAVALGRQFKEMLPTLWMKAGAIGKCPDVEADNIPDIMILPENKFAVLIDERCYLDFITALDEHPEIETVYIVTDSDAGYRDMIAGLEDKNTYQLYVEPSRIADDKRIKIVFFKETLSTGWDCPRAETMMSFRPANDHTYIAQLLGRMVRTPMQMSIKVDETLNDVHLYLPQFNESTVYEVVEALRSSEGANIPTDVEAEQIGTNTYDTLTLRPTYEKPARKQGQKVSSDPNQISLDFDNPGAISTPNVNPVNPATFEPAVSVNIPSVNPNQNDTTTATTFAPPSNEDVSPVTPDINDVEGTREDLPDIDREAVVKTINDAGLLTYNVRRVHIANYLKSVFSLARFLTQTRIDFGALENVISDIINLIHTHIEDLKKTGFYDTLVDQVLQFKLSTQIFDVFGRTVDNNEVHDFYSTTDTDIERQFRLAEARLGNEGVGNAYCSRYYEINDALTNRINVIIFAADARCMDSLNAYAKDKFHELNDENRRRTVGLPERFKKKYDDIVSDGDIVSKHNFRLPETIRVPREAEGVAYNNHLFVDDSGSAVISLNGWEQKVIEEEQSQEEFVCWLRNPSRGSWALCIPYEIDSEMRPTYPDFLVIRKDGPAYVVDVLEPHDPTRIDNLGKAKGFAEYARQNPGVGRIELIKMKKDSVGKERPFRLDMSRSIVRDKVSHCANSEELNHIFEEFGYFM